MLFKFYRTAIKLNLSETDTQPDIYETNIVKPASLSLQLEGDGIVKGVLEDVKGNCAVRKIHVQIANDDNKIVLVVYHDKLEALADCICNYDVSFKMSRLSAGDYGLKIYFASPGMKYTEEDLMYNGRCKLEKGHTTKITLKQGALPEVWGMLEQHSSRFSWCIIYNKLEWGFLCWVAKGSPLMEKYNDL